MDMNSINKTLSSFLSTSIPLFQAIKHFRSKLPYLIDAQNFLSILANLLADNHKICVCVALQAPFHSAQSQHRGWCGCYSFQSLWNAGAGPVQEIRYALDERKAAMIQSVVALPGRISLGLTFPQSFHPFQPKSISSHSL